MNPKSTKITFRLDKDLKVKLDIYCATNQVTQTETLVTLIEALVGAVPLPNKEVEKK